MTFLIIIVVTAVVFDFINGFHDSANAIATVISTKVFTPTQAVIWAASFNFLAFFLFTEHGVADTMKKMVHEDAITEAVLFGGLIGAIAWNLITWWWGIPSSSSHALLGGFTGAAFAKAGVSAINISKLTTVILFIPLAPIIGMLASYIISIILLNVSKKLPVSKVDKYFRRLQYFSNALFCIGHGGNDAQKTMGIIWAALALHGLIQPGETLPTWVAFVCYAAMSFGTLFGGWRIVKTMGQKLAKLRPFEGFCAEAAGALTLFAVTGMKVPVSTTHTVTGAIMGTGLTKRLSAVRWGIASNIVFAWFITIPAAAIMGGITFLALRLWGI